MKPLRTMMAVGLVNLTSSMFTKLRQVSKKNTSLKWYALMGVAVMTTGYSAGAAGILFGLSAFSLGFLASKNKLIK